MNVADDATRVKDSHIFDPDRRWIRGLAWLCDDEDAWPVQPEVCAVSDCVEEVRKQFVGVACSRETVSFE